MRIVIDTEIIAEWVASRYWKAYGWIVSVTVCAQRGHVPYLNPIFGHIFGPSCSRCGNPLEWKPAQTPPSADEARYKRAIVIGDESRWQPARIGEGVDPGLSACEKPRYVFGGSEYGGPS